MDNKKIWNWIKRGFKIYIYSEIVFIAFLIFIIVLCFLFALLNLESQNLTASITFALLIITYFYIVNTSRIIRESKIDRELKNIKEKLSELYSLLKFHPTILQITPEEFYRLKKRSYLARENMQKLLDEYFEAMDKSGCYADTKFGKMLTLDHNNQEFVDLKKRFDEQVNADYKYLLDKKKKIGGEED